MKVEIEPEVFEKMKELYADYLEEKRIGEKVSTLRSLSNNIFTVEYAHKKAGDAEGFFDLLFPTYLVPYVIPVVAILVAVGFLWLYL